MRETIFSAKHAEITAWNQQTDKTHTLGHNQFSTWTESEFKKILGFKKQPTLQAKRRTVFKLLDESVGATPVNWLEAGAVTPVKNQGSCGSCWSFSTTGALEGAHFIKTGELLSLSEQQLVSCSKNNAGCDGGAMDLAFLYTESIPLMPEDAYPYTSGNGAVAKCAYDASKGVVGATTYSDVLPENAAQLKAALAKGPISVAIEADRTVFNAYKSGVITSSACGTNLDHAVLTVAWGTDATAGDYYIVKNSWGPQWGDSGYVKIGIKDGKGVCGIQEAASYPSSN